MSFSQNERQFAQGIKNQQLQCYTSSENKPTAHKKRREM